METTGEQVQNNGGARASSARGLGWFSLGVGLAEVSAPRAVAKLIGVDDNTPTRVAMRVMGAREIASGVGILARPERPGPVWARVLGDVIDLGLLVWAVGQRRSKRARLALAIASVAGVTAIDVLTSRKLERAKGATEPVERSITVQRAPLEVYGFWRNLQNLPLFMAHVDAVRVFDERRAQWTVEGPSGALFAWDIEIVDDRPGERLAWRSVEGAVVDHRVSLTFRPAPGGRGTEIKADVRFGALGRGPVGALVKLFTSQQVALDLLRFKQTLETGEVVRSDSSEGFAPHPAQPSAFPVEQAS